MVEDQNQDESLGASKSKKVSTEPYKGVRDFYPEDQATQNYMFKVLRQMVEKVGYVEYGASILEPAELYRSKGAENEEIANEQTYTFTDRGGREVTLRPEMTPTVARMVAARRRELGFPLRLYSIPNVFRYERPQKGRLREHWQLNVDIFGSNSPYADAEILGVAYGIMRSFGAKDSDFEIKVNSRAHLDGFAKEKGLSAEGYRELLKLLDRKNKIAADEFAKGLSEIGVSSSDFSAKNPPKDIAKMIAEFKNAGIGNVVYDPTIVRGFDYYTGMVFEVFDTDPTNNRSLFGRGRYDNLTALFDTEPIPGVGFGMGDVTLREFLSSRNLIPPYTPTTQLYLATTSEDLALQVQTLAGKLRRGGINVAVDFGEKKLADQLRMASKHKIPYLIVVGEDELASGNFKIKDMASGEETAVTKDSVLSFISQKEKTDTVWPPQGK